MFVLFLREIQLELKQKVGKEHRSVVRVAEKLREKSSQRVLRHMKATQDKRSKDRLQNVRYLADTLQATKLLVDKLCAQYLREWQQWQKALRDRVQTGQDAFHGIEVRG